MQMYILSQKTATYDQSQKNVFMSHWFAVSYSFSDIEETGW